jgi:hypothetical protein
MIVAGLGNGIIKSFNELQQKLKSGRREGRGVALPL